MTTIKQRREAVASCVIGYLRVSTAEQATSGLGLEAQRAAITAYAERAGWTVTAWHTDAGVSGTRAPNRRPGLTAALDAVANCEAGILVAAKVDRLARDLGDLNALRKRAEAEGWLLAVADGSVDLTTPHGRAMFGMLGVFAELEAELIQARTRDALNAKRAKGENIGRKSALSLEVRRRIVADREAGVPWRTIVANLNAEGVPTGQGGSRWHLSSLQKAHASAVADGLQP